MKILSIELNEYIRFALTLYKNFLYRPDQKFQLILGTNGSGKSSLMNELSPLPAVSSDFNPGGFKEIKYEKDNQIYTLRSQFGSSGKHSFKLQDEELNTGGTASVQRDLVEKYFNITNEIHDVMTGKERFSTMSVAKRREWFTRMSHIDFNYAVKLYQNLKSRHREIDNVLKYQQSLLLTELIKLVDPQEAEKLKQEISSLEHAIDCLITEQEKIERLPEVKSHTVIEDRLSFLVMSVRSQLKLLKPYGLSDAVDSIQNGIYELELKQVELTTKSNLLAEQIEKNQLTLKHMADLGQLTEEDLRNQLKTRQEAFKNKTDQLVYLRPNQSPDELASALEIAYQNLFEIVQSIPENPDKKLSKQTYLYLEEQLEKDQLLLKTQQSSLLQVEQALQLYEHAKSHQQTTCPQCQYVWVRDFDEPKYQNLLNQKETLKQSNQQLSELIEKDLTQFKEVASYLEQYRQYIRTRDQVTSLYPLWEYLDEEQIFFKNPRSILYIFEQARGDIAILKELNHLQSSIKEAEKLILIQEKNTSVDIQKLSDETNAIMFHYADLLKQTRSVEFKLNQQRTKLTLKNKLDGLVNEMQQWLTEAYKTNYDEIQSLHWKGLKDILTELKIDLNEKKQRLASSHLQQEIVNRLKTTIEELVVKKETLTTMVDKLSPKDGLIARSLTGFINHFVSQMNLVISQIWSYPFDLLPINESEESLDLNYRFEVSVNNQKPIPDILKCSSGMQEVIDLAFKIVSMSYLNLGHAPIFLDEFGKSMDSLHRSKAFDTITTLIANSNYSQIFMVSHYEQAYGALQNADLIVLDAANIVIPPGSNVNRVVTIQ